VDEKVEAGSSFTIYAASSHHESARGLIQNKTLWSLTSSKHRACKSISAAMADMMGGLQRSAENSARQIGRFWKTGNTKHSWDDPLISAKSLAENQPYRLDTPMIGEVVRLDDSNQVFRQWWKGVN
jgi:hypothetical protein